MTEAVPVERVLVVDDDPDINRLLGVRLSARGFKVRTAVDGEDALAKIEAEAPDLIFLDVSMPGIDGLQVLDRVRGQGLDLGVVMTTAFGSEQVAIEALRRGADDYLRKPFESGEFQAVLKRTVGKLELTRQNVALRAQLDEQRRQLEAEIARAAQVQRDLLPRELPSLPGIELAARCVPARTVGGDFYDWQAGDDGTLNLTLGDVMGKGMPAALLMATVRAALRAVAGSHGPVGSVSRAQAALEADLERAGSYLTLFHGEYDPGSHCLSFVDAGHGHVFVRRAGGDAEPLGPRGLPVGMAFGLDYEEGIVALAPGDALVLYSDGLIDAAPDGSIDRPAIAAALDGAPDAAAMLDRLIGLAGPLEALPDDLTVVVLRRAP